MTKACADGMFVSGPVPGGYGPSGEPTFEYFRFYEDGAVVHAVVSQAPDEDRKTVNQKVEKWLDKSARIASHGTYRLDGGSVGARLTNEVTHNAWEYVFLLGAPPYKVVERGQKGLKDQTLILACPLR